MVSRSRNRKQDCSAEPQS